MLLGGVALRAVAVRAPGGGSPARASAVTLAAATGLHPAARLALGAAADERPLAAPFPIVPPWRAGASHTVLQAYGTYEHQNTNSTRSTNDFHALDFDLALGEAVYPIADGTILYAGSTSGGWAGYGNIVFIDHAVNGEHYQSLYAHLSSIADVRGAVSTTTQIGRAGATGTWRVWLHLAIYHGADFSPFVGATGPFGGVAVLPES